MSECICDQCEIEEESCPANQAILQVAELTARAEQAETREKVLRSKAQPLYKEAKDTPYYNMSSWERGAYAIIQALAGERENRPQNVVASYPHSRTGDGEVK